MQIPCPYCERKFPIEAALNDVSAREAVVIALKMPPPIGDLILRYITLFRPRKSASNWSRASRLMSELLEQIQAGEVKRDGRTWAAPLPVWQAALERLQDRRNTLTLPLTSHGLLYTIAADLADKAAGQAEKQQEQVRQQQPAPRDDSGPVSAGSVVSKALAGGKLRDGMRKLRKDTGV